MWIHAFPRDNSVLCDWSPHTIVSRRGLYFDKHCVADFGSFVEVHKDADVINTMSDRNFSSIYLGPTGNIQGTLKVFAIKTGKTKKPRKVTSFPMLDSVMAIMEKWGQRSAHDGANNKLEFLNHVGKKYNWDNINLDVDKVLVEPEATSHPDVPDKIPGVDLAREQPRGSPVTVVEELSKEEEGHNAQVNNYLGGDDRVDRAGVSTTINIATVDNDNIVALDDEEDVPNAKIKGGVPKIEKNEPTVDKCTTGDGDAAMVRLPLPRPPLHPLGPVCTIDLRWPSWPPSQGATHAASASRLCSHMYLVL